MTTGKTIALTRWIFVGKVISLLFNTLSRLVIAFLPRSKRLLISWLQSPSAVVSHYLKLIQLIRKTDWYFLLLYQLSKPPGRKYAKEKPVEKVFKNVFFIYSTIQFKKAAIYNENKTSFRACQSPIQILFFFFFQLYWDIISIQHHISLRCTVWWFKLHTSWSDYHNKFPGCLSSHMDTKLKKE